MIQSDLRKAAEPRSVLHRFAIPASERPLLLVVLDILILVLAGGAAYWLNGLL